MTECEKIKSLYEMLKNNVVSSYTDLHKFTDKGNRSAGERVRSNLLTCTYLCEELREKIYDTSPPRPQKSRSSEGKPSHTHNEDTSYEAVGEVDIPLVGDGIPSDVKEYMLEELKKDTIRVEEKKEAIVAPLKTPVRVNPHAPEGVEGSIPTRKPRARRTKSIRGSTI